MAIQVGNEGALYAMSASGRILKVAPMHTDTDAIAALHSLNNLSPTSRQVAMVVGSSWGTTPVSGKRCTQVGETMAPDCWTDNYLCVNSSSVVRSEFVTSVGAKNNLVNAGMVCVQWTEPSDADTWSDKSMCYHLQHG